MMTLICPVEGKTTQRYRQLIANILQIRQEKPEILRNVQDFVRWCEKSYEHSGADNVKCVVFAVHLDCTGINLQLFSILKEMDCRPGCLDGCVGAILVDGENELYTKNMAKKIAFSLSKAGCVLPGHTFAEATGSLKNQQKNALHRNVSLTEAFFANAREAVEYALSYNDGLKGTKRPKRLLCIYAGNLAKSNTYLFWQMVKKHLPEQEIVTTEINLRNGEIADCMGCPFEVCMHYSEKGSCFYGGVIVERVYPALMESDALMILCPNYNDSVSANIMAFINRLTALYRKVSFEHKLLFSIIVSGYSGSDILAEQLISSLHFNKGFLLPANGLKLLTANDPGEILSCVNVEEEAVSYAELIRRNLLQLY